MGKKGENGGGKGKTAGESGEERGRVFLGSALQQINQ